VIVPESLTPARTDDVLAFLARRPYENVYVHWLVASNQIGRGGGELVFVRDAAGRVNGTCYIGPQIVPCAEPDDTAALDAFVDGVRRARSSRMFVGERPAVARLWAQTGSFFPAPVAIRTSQPVYAIERVRPEADSAGIDVARATLAELDELVPHSAAMIAGEVGGDPQRATSEFRTRTARIVDRGWWWRARVDGRLAFMCNVGSATPYTAQLQGVWTPPGMRGRGYATRALAAICARLLAEHPSLCLYVNDFNAPAIALYERVGFERVGEFQTILLP
jgi:RimJ/RimL family protein N-acetyltransferase